MKRVINSSFNSEEFIPEMTLDFVNNSILVPLKDKVLNKLYRRYRGIKVDLDDVVLDNNTLRVDVVVYNNKVEKKRSTFKFTAWDSYWDETDFKSHLTQKLNSFVDAIG